MATKKVPTLENYQFQPSVKDKDLSAPPAATKGHRYIVAATGSGDWTGHTGDIAIGNGSGWDFVTKAEGIITWIEDENLFYLYDGSNWIVFDHTKIHTQNTDVKIVLNDSNVTVADMGGGDEQIMFQENNAEIMRIRSGKVGILNNNPAEALDITGNIKLSGHIVGGDGTVNPTNLLSNGDFENWSAGTSVAPDGWTANLNGGSVVRESSIVKLGSYSVKLTSPQNNDAGLVYDIGQVKGMAYWRGRSVTVGIWIKSSNFGVDNGFIVTSDLPRIYLTPYITADEWTFISATWKVESDATNLKLRIHAAYGYGVAYFDGAMCVEGESIFAFSEGITPIPLGTAAAVLTANKGPAGCTAVTGWIAINIGGVQRFIPYW
jgi:hypothetical protein